MMTRLTTLLCAAAAVSAAIAGPTADLTPQQRLGATWTIWLDPDGDGPDAGGVFRRDMQWGRDLNAAGEYVELPCATEGPCYTWLRQVRTEPPAIDSRLQQIAYPCPESAPDLAAESLATVCTATVRPEADLLTAVRNEQATRQTAALAAYGIASPTDQTRAIGLLLAERAGQTISADDDMWLDGLGAVGLDCLDQIADRATEIQAWVVGNPGQVPALGDAEWPSCGLSD